MPVGFFFRPRFCDSSIRAPRDFVFMVLIATEILFLGFGLRFCRCALHFTIIFGFYLRGCELFRMVLFPMILFLPLELGFVFAGFEETGLLSFLSTRCVHVCVLWIPMRMARLG